MDRMKSSTVESRTVLTAHVDDECQRVSDANGAGDAGAGVTKALADLHVTLGRRQCERQRVARRHSATRPNFGLKRNELGVKPRENTHSTLRNGKETVFQ